MAEARAQTEQLVKARALLDQNALEPALNLLKEHLLTAPWDTDGLDLLSRVLSEANQDAAGDKVRTFSRKLRETISGGELPFNDPEIIRPMFDAGFSLIDVHQFDIAAKLLEQCVNLAPDEPVVRYELAFALMSLKRFDDALPHFEQTAKELNDFDTHLNVCVCQCLRRNIPGAKVSLETLAKMVSNDDEKREVQHRRLVLKRLEELGNRTELNARDWLYVLYGSILLHANPKRDNKNDDIKKVADTILCLRGVLEGLRMEFEIIEYYNPMSKPLARIISELMDLPLDSYKGPDRPDKALLVMAWASDIVGPHKSFIETSHKRTLFAYGLPWQEPLPIMPDIVGSLSNEFPMPWSDDTRTESVNDIVEKILERARHQDCDPDNLKHAQDTVEYFHLKRERMLLGNPETFPERPEYTAEIPS